MTTRSLTERSRTIGFSKTKAKIRSNKSLKINSLRECSNTTSISISKTLLEKLLLAPTMKWSTVIIKYLMFSKSTMRNIRIYLWEFILLKKILIISRHSLIWIRMRVFLRAPRSTLRFSLSSSAVITSTISMLGSLTLSQRTEVLCKIRKSQKILPTIHFRVPKKHQIIWRQI